MEVDFNESSDGNTNANGTPSSKMNTELSVDDEIEQSIVQKFNCLNTSDREDLIRQLQMLFGSKLSEDTAVFYLDMNNWNLHAAICSYLDVDENDKSSIPSMTCTKPWSPYECFKLGPNVHFEQVFHLFNDGRIRWPSGCYIKHVMGTNLTPCDKIPVPSTGPGEYANITLNCVSPPNIGYYQGFWRLFTCEGLKFGNELEIILIVEINTNEITQQLASLNAFNVDENQSRNDSLRGIENNAVRDVTDEEDWDYIIKE